MISIDDYQKMMKLEFQRVKSLKSQNGYWLSCNRDDKIKYYRNDPVIKLKGVGKKSSQQLKEIGITTVGEVKDIMDITKLDNLPNSFQKKLTRYMKEAQQASNEDAPERIDHRLSANPYQSKFGNDWERHLLSSPTFYHSSYICSYIEHMMQESERVMKGTIHEKTWMVYHDALSIMTSRSTKEWMKSKGYLDRWILPSENLYNNLPKEARRFYEGKPVGNSPEFMPLDTHLNQDLHSSHDFHVTLTQDLPDDNTKKFDGSTPKRLSHSYQKLFHPETGVAPSSSRIQQDVSRVLHSLELVLDAKGCIIDENVRRGRRYEKNENISENGWGGKRIKSSQDNYLLQLESREMEIHSDAMSTVMEKARRDNDNTPHD